ncbi:MAG: aminopeptidase [Desulfuromonas sp.]|uniref:aminopeptidase n=1 Tax=Desulfuromonas sp. TaxID=892 RepID=UPI000CACA5C5|nr:aminopeptidase [Desulfuromonas sp.]PLX81953.1 MAG: aminopeptidase [Desulfuromonas sp.]
MRSYFYLGMLVAGGICLLGLAACTDIGYYAQCARGHLDIMGRCRPIAEILDDREASPELKSRLSQVLEIRDFASAELLLPENGSYRSYADLGRPYVVWNVVAAPEFSLSPMQWCFPIAGCVSYRGYFSHEEAGTAARQLEAEGLDVYLYGVTAYSTLNWFDDPVLNTFCQGPETSVAGLIFHELAHQKLYVKGDSSFNEAFAKAVELEGVRRWLDSRGESEEMERYRAKLDREEEFVSLVMQSRETLDALYQGDLDLTAKRAAKQRIIASLRDDYREMKDRWGGYAGYDRWFGEQLNNAKLASMSTYRLLVPAFQELLIREGGMNDFFRAAERIGRQPPGQRAAEMARLLDSAEMQHDTTSAPSRQVRGEDKTVSR